VGPTRPIHPGAPSREEDKPGDPRVLAAALLDQADRLTHLAGELRREAHELNAALHLSAASAESATAPERRFAPASENQRGVATEAAAKRDELPISDGARLMITNLMTMGLSREKVLGLMRDELGMKDPEAILARLDP
jgi:hypothetical protein